MPVLIVSLNISLDKFITALISYTMPRVWSVNAALVSEDGSLGLLHDHCF